MPRRGGKFPGRNNWNSAQNFNGRFRDEHDDRGKDSTRRVSFKTNRDRQNGGSKFKNYEMSVRAHLQEEDIDMNGFAGTSTPQVRRIPFSRGGRSRGGRGDHRKRDSPRPTKKLLPAPCGWYQISIPYMKSYTRDFVLKTIHSRLQPDKFLPLYYKHEQDRVTFYVEDFATADKILKLDRLITLPDGHKMVIHVRSAVPQIMINENLREKMLLVMGKRFNPVTKALDLSSFHTDPDLSEVYCSLARPQIMIEAINLIASRITDLVALNLDSNRIHITDHMKSLAEKLPNITILHMKNNKLTHVANLECFKRLPLTEIILDGNPLKAKFRDNHPAYVRAVRKIFPKLLKLDGSEFPPEISFDLVETMELPASNPSFICTPAAQDIVRQFLQQYFAIYDSSDRQPLLDAYHENAIMSLSVNFPNERTTVYNKYNRNLMRCRDQESRGRTLKEGRLRIVTFLSDLPKTQHDPMSFQVDLSFFTPVLMLLSVSGIFKELGDGNPPLRSFQRAMIIVPSGSGFCIRNDELCITNASASQSKDAFQRPVDPGPSPDMNMTPNNTLDIATKQQMVHQMSLHSNMNLSWSEKCLVETNWDLQRAIFVFMELNKENKVPPEAFIKAT